MSSAQHTLGPWKFLEDGRTEDESNCCKPLTIGCADACDLAQVFSADDSTVNISRTAAIANARLIASAPELLEVLHEILADGVHCDVVPHLHHKALAAIKKATGGTP